MLHISVAGHGEISILTHCQHGLSFGSHYSFGRKEVSEEILDALFMDPTRQTRAGRECEPLHIQQHGLARTANFVRAA